MTKTTQSERIAVIETKVDNIQTDTTDIKKMIERHIEHCEQNFAGKWVEKIAAGSLITIVGGIVILIIQLI